MSKFIIGIGSQRAGSTLLHRILSECTPIFMHPLKELHYYDTLFNVRNRNVLKSHTANQLKNFNKDPEKLGKRDQCFLRANRMLHDREVESIDYIDLYRPCVMGHEYLGEITPEYMILPEEGTARLREDVGGDAKIILLARNPVQRFISSVKLLKIHHRSDYDMQQFAKDIREVFETMPTWIEQQYELNDYETALERYRRYFDDVLFLCYDQFIDDPGALRLELEEFLGMPVNKEKFEKIVGKRVNALAETGNVPEDIVKMLGEKYKENLHFLRKRFGNESCKY